MFRKIFTFTIVAALLIFFIYYKKLTPLMRWAISFLVAGGIGNMIDRVFLGYVVDFLDFTLITPQKIGTEQHGKRVDNNRHFISRELKQKNIGG